MIACRDRGRACASPATSLSNYWARVPTRPSMRRHSLRIAFRPSLDNGASQPGAAQRWSVITTVHDDSSHALDAASTFNDYSFTVKSILISLQSLTILQPRLRRPISPQMVMPQPSSSTRSSALPCLARPTRHNYPPFSAQTCSTPLA